jgi:glucokinase
LSEKKSSALGLDLGGTSIKAAVVNRNGKLLEERQNATPADRSVTETVATIAGLINDLHNTRPDLTGVGLGSPGLVDKERRLIRLSPNFPDWKNVPLKELVAEKTDLPIHLENDVNCFALAEQRWGAAKGLDHVLALALGTGIGGGIVLNGELYRGDSGGAGELGHISVDMWGLKCNCGNRGCAERYVGVEWFVRDARDALDDPEISSPEEVSNRAEKGDQRAIDFIEGKGFIVGVVCTTLIHIFDPQAIVIGGGIAQCGEPLFHGIHKSIAERAYADLAGKVEILPAKLGTNAGAIGAAAIGFEAGKLL